MQSKLRKANRRGVARNEAKSPSRHGRRAAAEVNISRLSKKGRGRPAWTPEDKDRAYVSTMVAYGATHAEVCAVLNVDEKTLRKHCEQELAHGSSMFDNDLRWTLRMRAVGGPKREWQKASDTALIFVCKTRLKMTEPGKELNIGDVRIESLTDRQLDVLLERILARQTGAYGPSGEGQATH
jgi:hypothetical protein